jgi:hypothetical protein
MRMGRHLPQAKSNQSHHQEMSADNWTYCPKCAAAAASEREKAILSAGAQYGKIPADDYVALINDANKPVTMEATFRENFWQGLRGDTFEVEYHGCCTTCKFKHVFKHTTPLEL